MIKLNVLILAVALTLLAIFALPSQAEATVVQCCCLNALPNMCHPYETPGRCEQLDDKYFTADPSKCGGAAMEQEAGAAAEAAESNQLYFTPNVPIPGLFEGRVPVDGTLLGRYLRAFYVYFVWIVGILAVVMVMYAGIQWVTAAGNSSKIENAKSTMNGAFIGVVLTLCSYLILQFINPTLVKFQDLSIFTIPSVLLGGESYQSSEKGALAIPLPTETCPTPAPGEPPCATTIKVGKISNVTKWDTMIKTAAEAKGLDPFYVKAIMLIESRGNGNVQPSSAGACGLMQVLPSNCNGHCMKDESQAEENIRCGVEVISRNMNDTCPSKARLKSGSYVKCYPEQTRCTKNSWHYSIAAYNGGVGSNCSSVTCTGQTWWECQQNDGFSETRNYVPAVEAMYPIVRKWGWGSTGQAGQPEDCANGLDDDGDGQIDCTDSDCAEDPVCTVLPNVQNLQATAGNSTVTLHWTDPPPVSGFAAFQIKRKTGAFDSFDRTDTDTSMITEVGWGIQTAADATAVNNQTYTYGVFTAREEAGQRTYSTGVFAQATPQSGGNGLPSALCQEDFEGDFPTSNPSCHWNLQYSGTGYTWDEDSCRPSTGQGAAWAGNWHFDRDGFDPCTTSYPDGMTAFMVAGPYDLSHASEASAQFDWWLRSQGNGNDFIHVGYSLNGINFYEENSFTKSGDFGDTWHRNEVFSLAPVLGQTQVWIGFGFVTDMSTAFGSIPNGAFVDNVLITKVDGDPPGPPPSPPENCTNGADDDHDGLTDCADPDCASDPACAAVPLAISDVVIPLNRIEEHAMTIRWKTSVPATTDVYLPSVGTYNHDEMVTDHSWTSSDDGATLEANREYSITISSSAASGQFTNMVKTFVTDFTDTNGIRWEGYTDMPLVTWNGSTSGQSYGCDAQDCNQYYTCNADGLADCSSSAGHNYMSTTCGALARADCVDGVKDLPSGYAILGFFSAVVDDWRGTVLPYGNTDYTPACGSSNPPFAIAGSVWTRHPYPVMVFTYGADGSGTVGCNKYWSSLPSESAAKARVIWRNP